MKKINPLIIILTICFVISNTQTHFGRRLEEGDLTSFLDTIISLVDTYKPSEKQQNFLYTKKTHKDSYVCSSCLMLFEKAHDMMKKKYNTSSFYDFLHAVCLLREDKIVCDKVVKLYTPIFFGSVNDHYVNGELICTELRLCEEGHFQVLETDAYADKILEGHKEQASPEIDRDAKTLKALHVSDIHFDILYREGSEAECNEPLCCRSYSKQESFIKLKKSGRWGYLGFCDLPVETLESFTEYAFNEIKPDFVIWTGDNTAHDPWRGSQETAFEATSIISIMIQSKFKLPVYPCLGNHEIFPNDEFDPNNYESIQVLKKYADYFKNWLSPDSYSTFSKYGYYSQLHPSTNLRIIATNSLLCDTFNFNLIKDPTDPRNEVKWLENTLKKAEENGEVVYLLRHIPSGDGSFLDECARRFQALQERFSHIIRGQFYGHTHLDEIKLVHGYKNKEKLSGVMFIAPSLTTYLGINPSFRVFEIDSNTKKLKDYVQYRFYVDESNKIDNPVWKVAYRATDYFNVRSLDDFDGLNKFVLDIQKDDETYKKALNAFWGGGPNYEKYLKDKNMPRYLTCRFNETLFLDYIRCVNLKTIFDDEYACILLDFLAGKWNKKSLK